MLELRQAYARAPILRAFLAFTFAPLFFKCITMSVKPDAEATRKGVLPCWSRDSRFARRSISRLAIRSLWSPYLPAASHTYERGVCPLAYPVHAVLITLRGVSLAKSSAAQQIRQDQVQWEQAWCKAD